MRMAVARTPAGPRVVVDAGQGWRGTVHATLRQALESGIVQAPGAGITSQTLSVTNGGLGSLVGPGSKVICVGHNYRNHIVEMGHEIPDHPNVFSKFAEAIIGPDDPILLSGLAEQWDWEAELAVVIAKPTRRVSADEAPGHIAGYTVANDISARDWQRRSSQWLLGKTFEGTTPIGPWLVTTDEAPDPASGLRISCSVDGVEKQSASTADLVFDAPHLVAYLSQVLTLQPGDVVLTGTPGGVGAARQPVERLRPGQTLVTEIEGIGRLTNTCTAVQPAYDR